MNEAQDLEAVCAELRSVIERLDSLAFDALREAVASGGGSRPELERRITRARHALERALHQLERAGEGEGRSDDEAPRD